MIGGYIDRLYNQTGGGERRILPARNLDAYNFF